MSAKSCLQRRTSGYFYFRKKIPIELRSILGKKEIVRSLKTNNKTQATKLALQLDSYTESYFDKIRLGQPISIHLIDSCTITSSGQIIFGEDDGLNYTFQHILQKWIKANRPSDSAIAEWKLALRQFAEIYGDIEVSKITTAHIIKYRELISALPARYNIKHPGLTLHEVKALYHNREIPEPVANTTILKRMGALKSLLSFAKNEGLILTSPADNIKLKGGKHSVLIRKCFSKEDLTTIFKPLEQYNNHKYWIPLIALYTGARLEELGQLEVTDLKQEGSLYYFDINSEGRKRLKTKSSARRIPLHNKLIEAGFLDYAASLNTTYNPLLFPQLGDPNKPKLTRAYSKSFARHLDKVGISDKAKVFHSFRHTFKDACRNAEIPEDIHDALTGHSNSSVSRRYGSGHKLEVLDKYLQWICYE